MLIRLLLLVSLVLTLSQSISADESHHHHHGDHEHHDHEHGSTGEAAVHVLSQGDFHSSVTENPVTLVEFFAPWCGHCKQLAPQYQTAAERLRDEHQSSARLASVDCTVERDLCTEFGVKGFPTLKLFTPSTVASPVDYKGGRTADDIVNFMLKQSAPAYSELKNEAEAEKFLKNDGVKIIGVFADLNDENAKLLKEVAASLRNDYFFGLTDKPELLSQYSLSAPSISIVKPNEPIVTFDQSPPHTSQSIISFINSEAFPIFSEIGPDNYQKFMDRGIPVTWVFYDPKDESLSSHTESITEAAKSVKGKLSVVKLDGIKWAEHMKHFGLPAGSLPGIVIEDRESGRNFHFPASTSLSADSLKSFFISFLDKSLQPNIKTEAEPADNNGPVKVIVGSSFDSEVINNDRDVFVEFYAPWCGHCKSLAPKWDELGELFTDNADVVIAKVDATANDTPAKVQGFPTLILYPKGGKSSPINYEGDRTPHAMADWIRANGGTFKESAAHSEL